MAVCVAARPGCREGRKGRRSLESLSWRASCRGDGGGSGNGHPRGLGDPGLGAGRPSACLHVESGGGS